MRMRKDRTGRLPASQEGKRRRQLLPSLWGTIVWQYSTEVRLNKVSLDSVLRCQEATGGSDLTFFKNLFGG